MNSPRWRRALFALVAVVAVLGVVELGLRASGYADAPVYTPPRLVQIVQEGKYQGTAVLATERRYEAVTLADGQAGYRTAAGYRREGGGAGSFTGVMRDLSFSAERTTGVSRLFFLGESAVMGLAPAGKQRQGGEPWQTVRLVNNVTAYADRQTIPGKLLSRLQAAGKQVEMINAGMVAQDGAAIRGLAAEVLGYQPSALVVYLGNNEEIGLAHALRDEQVPVVSAARSGLSELRLYRLLANFIVPRAAAPAPTFQKVDRPRLLPTIVEAQWAANPSLWDGEDRRDAVFLGLLRQYREAVAGTVKLAADAGVPLVFL
ncbi:MAG: hypothetical protein FJ102_12400, partial [Deltaproteobacteria bacterium]|nr:hypothetical protein [Deltaproteobacteria bacterium]